MSKCTNKLIKGKMQMSINYIKFINIQRKANKDSKYHFATIRLLKKFVNIVFIQWWQVCVYVCICETDTLYTANGCVNYYNSFST